jgi:hypothetical protein
VSVGGVKVMSVPFQARDGESANWSVTVAGRVRAVHVTAGRGCRPMGSVLSWCWS